jgi:hypothetical protein
MKKDNGILKIPRIRTRKTQAFQEGGTVAVSKAYDWRDDPYELMLLQKAAQTTAGFARQVEKRHLHLPGKKIDTFLGLKAGYPLMTL